jgi:hypothetical protein
VRPRRPPAIRRPWGHLPAVAGGEIPRRAPPTHDGGRHPTRPGRSSSRPPGRGDVFAEFKLTDDRLEEIRRATADGGKALPWFECDIVGEDGTVVARVRKQLYVRRKPPKD